MRLKRLLQKKTKKFIIKKLSNNYSTLFQSLNISKKKYCYIPHVELKFIKKSSLAKIGETIYLKIDGQILPKILETGDFDNFLFNFLKKKSEIFLYDDNQKNFKNLISYKNLKKTKFDFIIISPGIDINKCQLSNFLKKNSKKIYTDLDIFFSFFNNNCITVTGTNGKSTTCQLLYEVLLQQNYHVKLVGNIGNPILSLNKIKPKTIFIIEASSYQLSHSKFITPDELKIFFSSNGLKIDEIIGMKYNPLFDSWSRSKDLSVNYLGVSSKINS